MNYHVKQAIFFSLTKEEVLDHFYSGIEVICNNGTFIIAKFMHNGIWKALKLCNVHQTTSEAQDEITNEIVIFDHLNQKKGILIYF